MAWLRSLFRDRSKRAVPLRPRRVLLEQLDARKVQIVELLAGAGKFSALLDQFARLVPLLRTQRLKNMFVKSEHGAEFRAGAHDGGSEQRMQLECLAMRAGGNVVDLEKGESALGLLARGVSDNHSRAILRRQLLDASGNEDAVAGNGISGPSVDVEAACNHTSGRNSHADLDRRELGAGVTMFLCDGVVGLGKDFQHRARCLAGVRGMFVIIERGIPEGTEAVDG